MMNLTIYEPELEGILEYILENRPELTEKIKAHIPRLYKRRDIRTLMILIPPGEDNGVLNIVRSFDSADRIIDLMVAITQRLSVLLEEEQIVKKIREITDIDRQKLIKLISALPNDVLRQHEKLIMDMIARPKMGVLSLGFSVFSNNPKITGVTNFMEELLHGDDRAKATCVRIAAMGLLGQTLKSAKEVFEKYQPNTFAETLEKSFHLANIYIALAKDATSENERIANYEQAIQHFQWIINHVRPEHLDANPEIKLELEANPALRTIVNEAEEISFTIQHLIQGDEAVNPGRPLSEDEPCFQMLLEDLNQCGLEFKIENGQLQILTNGEIIADFDIHITPEVYILFGRGEYTQQSRPRFTDTDELCKYLEDIKFFDDPHHIESFAGYEFESKHFKNEQAFEEELNQSFGQSPQAK